MKPWTVNAAPARHVGGCYVIFFILEGLSIWSVISFLTEISAVILHEEKAAQPFWSINNFDGNLLKKVLKNFIVIDTGSKRLGKKDIKTLNRES